MDRPWWEKRFAPVSGNHWSNQWAVEALVQDALKGGDAAYDGEVSGTPLKPFEEMLQVLSSEPLNGHMILSSNFDYKSRYFVWPHGMVFAENESGDFRIRCTSSNREFYDQIQKVCKDFIGPRISSGRVYVLVSTAEGPEFHSIGVAACPLERGNYIPKVITDFDHVVSDLQVKDPCGRLIVLDGVCGTGKSYLLRGLLHAVPKALFIIVPVNLIPELANPGMINSLIETRDNSDKASEIPTVFLVEDADDCLTPRASDNVNHVSALLNLSDGILGQLFDIRLVCTTNAKTEDLDEAVVRPGRLCRFIHVDPLDAVTAEAIYEKLTGKKAGYSENSKMTLAEVYRLARDGGWQPEKKQHVMGFSHNTPTRNPY